YFARSVTAVPDDATAVARLQDLDPARETLVVGPEPAVEPDPAATVTVQDRDADRLTLRYRASTAQLVRIAIPYFPGWHASLHGAELPILKADRAFQAVVVPPGEDEIKLWYSPRFFWWGAVSSGLALLANLAV